VRIPDWANSFGFVPRFGANDAAQAEENDNAGVQAHRNRSAFGPDKSGVAAPQDFERYLSSSQREELFNSPSSPQSDKAGDRRDYVKAFSQTWDLSLLKAMKPRNDVPAKASESPSQPADHALPAKKNLEGASTKETIMNRFKNSSAFSYDHSMRVGELAGKLAEKIAPAYKKENGSPDKVSSYYNNLGKYHDIGKYAIPYEILEKPDKLTPEETQVVRAHPIVGETMLKENQEFQDILPAVRHHHERWDGKGYPDGLKGDAIPLEARIISVVDSFDAIVSDRPYRKGVSPKDALVELNRCAGTQFDPQVVDFFTKLVKEELGTAA
jgi:HD-GYP domain-containing protein (c-di-GMP phosphodiesterase class II)